MKSYFLIIVLSLLLISCGSVKNDASKGKSSLSGKVSKQTWIDSTQTTNLYKDYQADGDKISRLKEISSTNTYHFVVFAGADCSDCHEYLPKLFKIFDMAGITEDNYDIYVLDNKLEEPSGAHKEFDIPTSPSVFVLKDKSQIGLITYPYYDWLNQIIKIIEKDIDED
jgi:thioredoxin-related protein